jgi:hypothetical protein
VPDSLGFWNDRPPIIPSQSCALSYLNPKIKTSGAGVKRHELYAMTVPRRGPKVKAPYLFKLIGSPDQVEAITANFENRTPMFGDVG